MNVTTTFCTHDATITALVEALEAVRDAIADTPSTMPQYSYAARMDEYTAQWARLKAKIDAALALARREAP